MTKHVHSALQVSSHLYAELLGSLQDKQKQLYMLMHKGIIHSTSAIAGKDLNIWNMFH